MTTKRPRQAKDQPDAVWSKDHYQPYSMDAAVPQPPAPAVAAVVVRLRFQGHSAISIPTHPEIGTWEPGYYRTVPEELAAVLRWNHRPREGMEPDFIVMEPGYDDLPPNVGTRADGAISRADWERSRA